MEAASKKQRDMVTVWILGKLNVDQSSSWGDVRKYLMIDHILLNSKCEVEHQDWSWL